MLTRRIGLAVAAVLCLGVAGCASDAPEADPVIAVVDGLEMTADDYLRSYIDYLVTTGQNDTEALRQRHFEALVDAYLLGAEAERRGLAADSALDAASALARRRLVGARYYEASVLDTLAAPAEADVRRAYQLGTEQRVVRQLYFTDADSAQAAYARLQAGRPFLEEAWDLYGTRDSTAGSLGAVSYWQVDDAFAEAAFGTPVGEVTPPVRSRLGYHIIKVEDRLRNPVLSEDEFARRRKGVESQLRLRRRRLEGDSFVRDFMGRRNVAVNGPALRALQQAVAELEGDPPPDAQQGGGEAFTPGEIHVLTEALQPQTPLATFDLGGRQRVFTVEDYLFWLDVLPFSEARNRTGASLGRALRNEALAQAGEAAGVADEPEVRHELARMDRLRLADALRARLRADSSAADRARLGQVADRLALDPRQTVADFWVVSFESRAEAEGALAALRASPASAEARPGFERFERQPLAEARDLAAAVRSAPLGEPVLAATGDGRWVVLRVADRAVEATGDAADALAPFAAEAGLIERLRAERPIEIHEEALAAVLRPPPVPTAPR
ncbi:hypothetical protein BSZ37_12205 [Rubrivirga marina]|uniref:PpiC domain-containing protein n=1 Tax=Rubrivirga marina TaxID=1196024 RepID=A0A271J2E7_9BACT|nr:hypothetical protein BSZ37_12205 [Rubrivirga marina]